MNGISEQFCLYLESIYSQATPFGSTQHTGDSIQTIMRKLVTLRTTIADTIDSERRQLNLKEEKKNKYYY